MNIQTHFSLKRDLSVTQPTLDYFLRTANDAVHGLNPFPLRPTLQIFIHALGPIHLPDDKLAAFLRLLVEVGKIGMQLACQNQVVEQWLVRFLQICPMHPLPLPDGAVITLRQFDSWNVVIPDEDIIKTICLIVDSLLQFIVPPPFSRCLSSENAAMHQQSPFPYLMARETCRWAYSAVSQLLTLAYYSSPSR